MNLNIRRVHAASRTGPHSASLSWGQACLLHAQQRDLGSGPGPATTTTQGWLGWYIHTLQYEITKYARSPSSRLEQHPLLRTPVHVCTLSANFSTRPAIETSAGRCKHTSGRSCPASAVYILRAAVEHSEGALLPHYCHITRCRSAEHWDKVCKAVERSRRPLLSLYLSVA